jgi:Integrase core domain
LGNSYDNAKAEVFLSTLKAGSFAPSNCFQSKDQAGSTIFEYLEVYYSNQRPHSALGYKSPRQCESRYQSEEKPVFLKAKVTATSSAEGGAKVKRANGQARRGTPLMPDRGLNRRVTFCL